jgi:hypothetical protein
MILFKQILYFFCSNCRSNKSSTVRYAFPLVFTLAAFLGAAAIVTDNKSFIHLESSVASVKAGEMFEITIFVSAHVPVNAVDITLEFPKNQISIVSIDKGESVLTLWTQEPRVENNKVYLTGGTFRRGFIGDHIIATINARATQSGLAKFSVDTVSLLAGDGSGTKVSVTKNDKESTTLFITKEDGTKTPETDAVGVQGVTSVVLVTDIDGDGQVTLADISRFMAAWNNKSITYDFNGDGTMSFRDFGIILADSFLR